MIHLGDITKIRGDAIPPVDCITGGSPCQDLSVAGKRAGLAGERSGLFMEQIRIVKEMRERDIRNGRAGVHVRPRFMVWENVPGAFSSNKGADFQAVLTEIVKIVEPDAPDVPLPDKGKWPKAGCLYSDVGDWSVAWRVHDAQFWGVPQRRKRIALVADFGGLAAPEILFEREGLSRDPEPRGAEGQGASSAAESGAGCAISFQERAGKPGGGKGILIQPERTGALSTLNNQSVLATAYGISSYESNAMKSPNPHSGVYEADTARTLDLNGGSCAYNQGGVAIVQAYSNQASGLVTKGNGEAFLMPEKHMSLGCGGGQAGQGYPAVYIPDVAHALSARHDGSPQPDKGNGANIVAVHQNASGEVRENDVAYTIGTNTNASGRNTPLVYDARGNGDGKTAPTMTGDHQSRVTDYTAVCVDAVQTYQEVTGTLNPRAHPGSYNGQDAYNDMLIAGCFQNTGRGWWNESDVAATLRTPCGGDSTKANLVAAVDCRNGTENPDINGTLQAKEQGQNVNSNNVCRINQTVRRLTPLECERLQGFPDGWTDIGEWTDTKGKKHKAADSPRYKALGNSIALPFWFYLLRRISAQYERLATLGSLFDGIGGFPLCWERCNGKGTAIWASEIEEFPIAVTKVHFPEEKEDT